MKEKTIVAVGAVLVLFIIVGAVGTATASGSSHGIVGQDDTRETEEDADYEFTEENHET